MKRVLVLIDEGFEEVEALTVVDYLRRVEEIEVDLVSGNNKEYVTGAHEITVQVDKTIAEIIDIGNYEAVVIPGGMPGAENLKNNENVINIIKAMNNNKRYVAAICAGPIVLEEAGILENKDVTSYPGFEDNFPKSNYKTDPVVVDDNIITSRGPNFAVDFALMLIKLITNKEKRRKVAEDILGKADNKDEFK